MRLQALKPERNYYVYKRKVFLPFIVILSYSHANFLVSQPFVQITTQQYQTQLSFGDPLMLQLS